MRSFILPAMIVLAFSSCASYQYVTLDSTEVRKNDKKEFSWENDTMRMTYKPLYVNWKKSAMIRGGHAASLFNSNVQINGSYAGYGRRATFGSINASFDMPEGMDLIPPG